MSTMWVDKYKPKHSSDLAGQGKSVARLKAWLKTYDSSRSRPVFIYGPPGIGKTTAAHLCCKELGYQTVEFNASDQRNKNIIKDVISTVAGNSRLNFLGRASETKDAIILDEVDGMAGNEDRGGIAQLILELKNTKKPMIFICNDGQHQKLRALKDKCETIEFRKPEYESIRSIVHKVATNEKLRVDKIDIRNLAESSDYDIRQILNSLTLFRDGGSGQMTKTTRLNSFEATKKVLTASKHSLETRFDCFFADYNIMPLFMFENYIKNRPAKGDQLRAISRAAEAFCISDLADKEIRSRQNWSLLNTQALLSTVIPSKLVESHNVGRVDFPQFLGKLSNANKRLRLTQELNAHMCLTLRGGLDADYLEVFKERLTAPLIKKDKLGGVDAVVDFMHDYSLLRDDFNSIIELATWSFKPDPMADVDTKTKLALTNTYKKRSIALPYFIDDKPAKKRKPAGFGDGPDDEADEEEEEEQDVVLKPKRVVKSAAVEKTTSKKKTAAKEEKKEVIDIDDEGGKTNKKAPTKRGRKPAGVNGKSQCPEPAATQSDDIEILDVTPANVKAAPERRPPPPPANGGIARFFTAKKQKSS